ncbi:exonuclease SbcCD subunit D [Methanolobus mangrovi]|uniref:DNA double-strand break repair protein Mre11 n=1 Tax=Methanolobus mangrovi TaxID=3072977 RepID=A0AA51UG56_9EURY|nr:exonuclease SbcCD subunit D [Methanolobus mangrovi]WMW21547.1 exonuclease SbcCD subunit D [Methanolobus mangrovi]
MDEIRIVHTGDTHLGYRQYHSDVRRQDFLNAFSTVVDDAISMNVDAVVHAGDLFDSRNPTLDDILDAMGLFSRLKSAGIPLLAIVGNHESKQSTQWLDLYSSLGLVTRLGTEPYRLGEVALYGIDSVPRTKIPLFDYSVFEGKATDARYNLLAMHQLVKPFAFGDWDIKDVIESIPFDVHAVLLGDNHKNEVITVSDAWVTYCGSTERNSTSEREPRAYNIVTIGEGGIEISKRVIPTREFVFIPVTLTEAPNAHDDVFSTVMEYDIAQKVVFVEISGDVKAKLDFSEIEKFLLARGALVPGIKDLRTGVDTLDDASLKVSFSDPDDVVKEEIKKMDLTAGGLLLDDIIRDPQIVKTKVDDEAETKLGQLLEKIDFTESVPSDIPYVLSADVQEVETFQLAEVNIMADMEESKEDTLNKNLVSEVPKTVVSEMADVVVENITGKDTAEMSVAEDAKVNAEIPSEIKKDEKESESKDKKTQDSVKPRQYNLGDYL